MINEIELLYAAVMALVNDDASDKEIDGVKKMCRALIDKNVVNVGDNKFRLREDRYNLGDRMRVVSANLRQIIKRSYFDDEIKDNLPGEIEKVFKAEGISLIVSTPKT